MVKASSDFINALCEMALNVISGNIPLTEMVHTAEKKESNH